MFSSHDDGVESPKLEEGICSDDHTILSQPTTMTEGISGKPLAQAPALMSAPLSGMRCATFFPQACN